MRRSVVIITIIAAGCAATTPDEVSVTTSALCDVVNDDDCVDIPDEDDAPTPGGVSFLTRTQSAIKLGYVARSTWTSHQLERRRIDDTTWTTVRTYAAVASGTREYTNTSLSPDTVYCYRSRATDPGGTGVGPGRCALTMFAGSPNPPIQRLQLRVKVANVENAETTDPVEVRLSSGYGLPGSNRTGLNDAPHPVPSTTWPPTVTWVGDFARGSDRTYDLDTTNLTTLRDITRIELRKRALSARPAAARTACASRASTCWSTAGSHIETCSARASGSRAGEPARGHDRTRDLEPRPGHDRTGRAVDDGEGRLGQRPAPGRGRDLEARRLRSPARRPRPARARVVGRPDVGLDVDFDLVFGIERIESATPTHGHAVRGTGGSGSSSCPGGVRSQWTM